MLERCWRGDENSRNIIARYRRKHLDFFVRLGEETEPFFGLRKRGPINCANITT
jgi:hypothetical protein